MTKDYSFGERGMLARGLGRDNPMPKVKKWWRNFDRRQGERKVRQDRKEKKRDNLVAWERLVASRNKPDIDHSKI